MEEAWAKYADHKQYSDYGGALALFGGWIGVDMAGAEGCQPEQWSQWCQQSPYKQPSGSRGGSA